MHNIVDYCKLELIWTNVVLILCNQNFILWLWNILILCDFLLTDDFYEKCIELKFKNVIMRLFVGFLSSQLHVKLLEIEAHTVFISPGSSLLIVEMVYKNE